MLLTLLSLTAHAAPCSALETPDLWAEHLDQIRDDVALANEGVAASLDELTHAATCTTGPIERRDLSRLWMARGAWLVLTHSSETDAARALSAAKALSGDEALDPIYGPGVASAFAVAEPAPNGKLQVYLPHQVLVIDGEVRYEDGEIELPAGTHLVQWSEDEAWSSAWIDVTAGCTTSFGAPAAAPNRAPRLVPLPSADHAWSGSVAFNQRYTLMQSSVYIRPAGMAIAAERLEIWPIPEGQWGRVVYTTAGPVSNLELDVNVGRAWLNLSGELAPQLPVTGRWPASQGVSLIAGTEVQSELAELRLGAGLRLARVPRARSVEHWNLFNGDQILPNYRYAVGLTPTVSLEARVGGPLGVSGAATVWGGPIFTGGELSLGPTLRYGALEPHLAVRLGGQAIARDATAMALPQDFSDKHGWWSLEAGMGWRF